MRGAKEMIKICIIHYEPKIMNQILGIIKSYQTRQNIGLYIIIEQRYELDFFIRHNDMDIAIINPDIKTNNYDGVFLAERIKIMNRRVLTIFLSGTIDRNFLLRIINAEPFAYIDTKDLKMVLPDTLDRAISILLKNSCIFTYTKRNEKFHINLRNVIYFVSSHRTIQFICIDGTNDIFYDKMDMVENIISKISNSFVRVNQSYLINREFILSVDNKEITMINKEIINISRKYHHNIELVKNISV